MWALSSLTPTFPLSFSVALSFATALSADANVKEREPGPTAPLLRIRRTARPPGLLRASKQMRQIGLPRSSHT